MEIREVEKMWKWDVIRRTIVSRNPNNGTWEIEFYSEEGKCIGKLEKARGGTREFRTLDAAGSAMAEIGINQFEVVI